MTHHDVGYPLCSSPSAPAVLPLNPAARLALGNGVRLSRKEGNGTCIGAALPEVYHSFSTFVSSLQAAPHPSVVVSPFLAVLNSKRHPLRRHDVLLIDSRTFVTDLMADVLSILAEQKSSNIKVMVIPFLFGWMHTNTRFFSPSLLRVLQYKCENGGSASWSAPPIGAYTFLTPFSPFLARMRPSVFRLDRS